jgi:hypothetical protein
MRKINKNEKITHNYHMFIFPYFTWSRVTFDDNQLIIAVDLLPLSPKKTRWTVTICHNYYLSEIQKKIVQMMAMTILRQDSQQMLNQHPETELKKSMLLDYTFSDETAVVWMKNMFQHYEYPDSDMCVELYNLHKKKQ